MEAENLHSLAHLRSTLDKDVGSTHSKDVGSTHSKVSGIDTVSRMWDFLLPQENIQHNWDRHIA